MAASLRVDFNVPIEMRDGVITRADVRAMTEGLTSFFLLRILSPSKLDHS